MALKTLQNFYKTTVATAWATGTGNRYITTLPTPSAGYLVINPGSSSKREIITYTAKGTDGGGNYITVSARGVGGTTEQTHAVGEPVRLNLTAQHYSDIQTELDLKLDDSDLDTDGTLAANSDSKIATQKATKTYAMPLSYLDTDVTLAANSDTKIATQKAVKTYADALAIAGSPNASTTQKGIVEQATNAEIVAGTSTGATGAQLFINPTDVATSGANKIIRTDSNGLILAPALPEMFTTESVGGFRVYGTPIFSYSDTTLGFVVFGTNGVTFRFSSNQYGLQSRTITSDWASADQTRSAIHIGSYIYLLLLDDSTAFRVYRYLASDIAAGGTLMTFSGQSLAFNNDGQTMFTDGTDFYFTYKAGNSANNYVVSKYTLSGTTFTYVSDITCGSTADTMQYPVKVDSSGNLYGYKASDEFIRKYDSSGTLLTTSFSIQSNSPAFYVFGNNVYKQGILQDVFAVTCRFLHRINVI